MTIRPHGATPPVPIQDNLTVWGVEILLNLSLITGEFVQSFLDIEFLAPVLLAAATGLAILRSPGALLLLVCPALMIMCMVIIDAFGYPDSITTVKQYIVWLMTLMVYLALQGDRGYFRRGKNFLLVYLLMHFFFLAPFKEDPSRMGLIDTPHLAMANPSDLAYWCIFAVLTSLSEMFTRGWLRRVIYLGIALTAFMVLLLTVSRGALLMLIIFGALFILLKAKNVGGIIQLITIACITGLIVSIMWVAQPEFFDRYKNRMDSEEGSYSGRSYLLDEAIKVIGESPWLGTGKDVVNPPLHSKAAVPHNQYLGLAVHYGIWPVVLLAMFWLQLLIKLVSLTQEYHTDEDLALITEVGVVLLFMLCMSMVSNVMLLSTFCAFYMAKLLVYQTDRPG